MKKYAVSRLKLLVLLVIASAAPTLAIPVAVLHILRGARGDDNAEQVILALDRLANATWYGDGRQTISYRAKLGMAAGKRRYCILCRLLDVVDKGHCENAQP